MAFHCLHWLQLLFSKRKPKLVTERKQSAADTTRRPQQHPNTRHVVAIKALFLRGKLCNDGLNILYSVCECARVVCDGVLLCIVLSLID